MYSYGGNHGSTVNKQNIFEVTSIKMCKAIPDSLENRKIINCIV